VAALVVLFALILQAAPKPVTLQGHVTRDGSGAPVAHARVVAAKVGGALSDYHTATSDPAGRFQFTDLSPGSYRVYATHDGYLQAEYGRRPASPSGVPVRLFEGQTSPDLDLRMTPTGAIAGRVLRGSEPVANVWVRALKARYTTGELEFTVADWTQTDDRGEYRLFGLAPGPYFVSASPRGRPHLDGDSLVTPAMASNANNNQLTDRVKLSVDSIAAAAFDRASYPVVYHPGTIDANAAQPIDVAPGAVVAGVDLALVPSASFHLRGQVIVDATAAGSPVVVSLEPGGSSYGLPIGSVRADASGAFDIPDVVPGRYFVSAQTLGAANASPASQLHDVVPVDITDHEPPPLTIALRRGVAVTGHVTLQGRTMAPDDPALLVQLSGIQARGSCCAAARVGADGAFTINNVTPRDYRLRVMQAGRTFWVRSVRFGGDEMAESLVRIGADASGRELEIVLDTKTSTLDALVQDANQHPLAGVLVIAVPPADRRDRPAAYRSATTGADGHAHLDGLAPFEYSLFASEGVAASDWQDPAILQRYAGRGTAVKFQEGESRTVTLRILP
jgi:hypothetical protein